MYHETASGIVGEQLKEIIQEKQNEIYRLQAEIDDIRLLWKTQEYYALAEGGYLKQSLAGEAELEALKDIL